MCRCCSPPLYSPCLAQGQVKRTGRQNCNQDQGHQMCGHSRDQGQCVTHFLAMATIVNVSDQTLKVCTDFKSDPKERFKMSRLTSARPTECFFSCWAGPVQYLELFGAAPVKKKHPVLYLVRSAQKSGKMLGSQFATNKNKQ